MKKGNIEIDRDIIINTIKSMSEEQLSKFIDKTNLDFRIWYRVKIDGELMPWWACECEIAEVKNRYQNVEFESITFAESWTL